MTCSIATILYLITMVATDVYYVTASDGDWNFGLISYSCHDVSDMTLSLTVYIVEVDNWVCNCA